MPRKRQVDEDNNDTPNRPKRTCTRSNENESLVIKALDENEWTLRKLERILFQHQLVFISFLQRVGLILSSVKCPICNQNMEQREKSREIDGVYWYCTTSGCKMEMSIRSNSFFSRSHLSLSSIITLAYCWFTKISQRVKLSLEKIFIKHQSIGTIFFETLVEKNL